MANGYDRVTAVGIWWFRRHHQAISIGAIEGIGQRHCEQRRNAFVQKLKDFGSR